MGANNINAIDYFETAKAITREHAAKVLAKAKRQPKPDFETVVYVLDRDGGEWEIEVGVSYDCTYDPGVYSGPWENSYPASGDMDIHDVLILDDNPAGITDDMVMEAVESARDRLEDEAWEHFHDVRNGAV